MISNYVALHLCVSNKLFLNSITQLSASHLGFVVHRTPFSHNLSSVIHLHVLFLFSANAVFVQGTKYTIASIVQWLKVCIPMVQKINSYRLNLLGMSWYPTKRGYWVPSFLWVSTTKCYRHLQTISAGVASTVSKRSKGNLFSLCLFLCATHCWNTHT